MFFQASSGHFLRVEAFGSFLDDQIAEDHRVDEAFDVRDHIFGEFGMNFVCETAPVDGENLDQMNRAVLFDFEIKKCMGY